ncbi:MAG: hypothetical protein JWP52_1551, partial [Rhizobacter sp.]|nr:hypothetical protein [Rhizobacter sp.]
MGRKRATTTSIPGMEAEKDPRFVESLARGIEVLRAFRPRDNWLSHRELVSRTGLPASTVSRLTFTLMSLGYLRHRVDAGEYALSPAVLGLGFAMLSNFDIGRIARPHMQELADACQAAVSMGARHDLLMIYVAHCRSGARLTLGLDVGARIPLMSTAMGRAVLCATTASEREGLSKRVEAADPTAWPAVHERFEEAQRQFAEHGFVTSESEWEQGISAAGVALDLGDGRSPL